MIKESLGQRGKTAQDRTRAHLEEVNNKVAHFAYERLADARAAGGALKKQIADFLCWWHDGTTGIKYSIPLEVKSTQHNYRIGKKDLTQLAILHKVSRAGGYPFVLVLFKGLNKWRIAPITFFNFGVPSWDMSELPLFDSAKDALESTGLFPKI